MLFYFTNANDLVYKLSDCNKSVIKCFAFVKHLVLGWIFVYFAM